MPKKSEQYECFTLRVRRELAAAIRKAAAAEERPVNNWLTRVLRKAVQEQQEVDT